MANFKVIKEICWEKKISLKQLCLELGISEAGLQILMKNNSTNTTTIEKIAKYLGVPVGIFFDETTGNGEKQSINIGTNNGEVNGVKHHSIKECEKEIEYLKKEVEGLKEQISILKEYNESLKNKKG